MAVQASDSGIVARSSFSETSEHDQSIEYDVYDVLGLRALVGGTPPEASQAIRSILHAFGPVRAGLSSGLPRYELVRTGIQWEVRVDGSAIQIDNDLSAAVSVVESHLITHALTSRDDLFHLHGASLCAPAQRGGVVLIGESGLGKTTLALALMLRGFAPYGDDVVLLDPETLELRALGRPFHVSEETWRLIEALAGCSVRRDPTMPPGFYSPPRWASSPAPVRWLLLIDFRPEQPSRLEPLSPAAAAAGILAHTLNLSRVPGLTLPVCARLTERAVCYRFVTGDLAASVALVEKLVSGSLSSTN